MARPSKPLISRTAAVAAAIAIIDGEGLDAFSLPRLAKHLGVKAPSLYHHFSDRTEILTEVARGIVLETAIPRQEDFDNWQDWVVAYGLNFRDVVMRHRNAAPLMLQVLPRNLVTDYFEAAAACLAGAGVPARLHVQILDGLEKLALGATLTEAMRPEATRSAVFADVDRVAHPVLDAALASNQRTPKQLYEQMMRSFLSGVLHDGLVGNSS
ncbi:TetR/AcrR family transcriptional regulator [Rhodococcus tukisamuensis]|uniref:DNA-binding transcriptional regulator, AcrR family n=1 Tax=Rhodococcus tukisamuensis TaxID=168276 RepID=A0A1G6SB42_9NOCA|nr:TetR/AcrR family transcriptional regulator [Rhodococcus tukisamuensis]SDD13891.1 DNA-binding transcriptional regulator, AcrR family [Rhodococcus tukisamuensis]